LGLVREHRGARVPKYEHQAGKVLGLHSKGIALLCALMLRGPQTLGELKINTHRLFEFDDLDDVQYALRGLIEKDPPMVVELPRQAGQKEGRYAHLLAGAPEIPEPPARATSPVRTSALESRVAELEAAVEDLRQRLEKLE
jgi:uncharacterized protein YceH (UPF0502 family)